MKPEIAILSLLFVGAAFGQRSQDDSRSAVTDVRYPPLAEVARLQGNVRIQVQSGVATAVSGHPLLAETLVNNAKEWASILGTDLDVIYHFVLVETGVSSVPTSVTVKRGNSLQRVVLRMFGRKTEKAVTEYRCVEDPAPPNDFRVADRIVEIWIFGREFCVETEAATLVATR